MSRTVILACSATKRHDTAELAAIARYDGPAWRVLRSNMTCAIAPPFALSAEYGLISAYAPIPDYDRRMTAARSRELVDLVAEQLERFVRDGRLDPDRSTLMFGGGVYRDCLEQARTLAQCELGRGISIDYTAGGIGEQLGQLKAFLVSAPMPELEAAELAEREEARRRYWKGNGQ
jgi:hypothetical protein